MLTGATRKGQLRAVATLDSVDSSPWPQPPPDLELSVVWIDGEELAVLSHRLDEPVPLEGLTEAERQIAEEIVDGLSNAQIARRRGTRSRTIAKQVGTIFRKLGVESRRQLAARVKKTGRSDRTRGS